MTVRLSNGLAFNQDRETKLFQDMARRGKHLDGTALMGHGWSFRDGPAEDWVYQIVYETDPDPEFFDLCRGRRVVACSQLRSVPYFPCRTGRNAPAYRRDRPDRGS